ncbi:uncharacterized protein METZ01_LOCUS513510, partial [marine metagenome]
RESGIPPSGSCCWTCGPTVSTPATIGWTCPDGLISPTCTGSGRTIREYTTSTPQCSPSLTAIAIRGAGWTNARRIPPRIQMGQSPTAKSRRRRTRMFSGCRSERPGEKSPKGNTPGRATPTPQSWPTGLTGATGNLPGS